VYRHRHIDAISGRRSGRVLGVALNEPPTLRGPSRGSKVDARRTGRRCRGLASFEWSRSAGRTAAELFDEVGDEWSETEERLQAGEEGVDLLWAGI
jgi:hypothetical protein